MENEKFTTKGVTEIIEFETISKAVEYLKNKVGNYYSRNHNIRIFQIFKGDEIVLSVYFKQIITLETVIV